MSALLDVNVLVALVVADHVHNQVAQGWFGRGSAFATCPVTQGALVRFVLRGGATASEALDVLGGLTTSEQHEFWPDDVAFDQVDLRGVIGHRQVTDAYLAALARSRDAQLVTLDRGLAALHGDVALLLEG